VGRIDRPPGRVVTVRSAGWPISSRPPGNRGYAGEDGHAADEILLLSCSTMALWWMPRRRSRADDAERNLVGSPSFDSGVWGVIVAMASHPVLTAAAELPCPAGAREGSF
jgi:hypothetical protein